MNVIILSWKIRCIKTTGFYLWVILKNSKYRKVSMSKSLVFTITFLLTTPGAVGMENNQEELQETQPFVNNETTDNNIEYAPEKKGGPQSTPFIDLPREKQEAYLQAHQESYLPRDNYGKTQKSTEV